MSLPSEATTPSSFAYTYTNHYSLKAASQPPNSNQSSRLVSPRLFLPSFPLFFPSSFSPVPQSSHYFSLFFYLFPIPPFTLFLTTSSPFILSSFPLLPSLFHSLKFFLSFSYSFLTLFLSPFLLSSSELDDVVFTLSFSLSVSRREPCASRSSIHFPSWYGVPLLAMRIYYMYLYVFPCLELNSFLLLVTRGETPSLLLIDPRFLLLIQT